MTFQKQHRFIFQIVISLIILWIANPGMALVVSEIMYRPADANETLEFIELYNNRAVFEDISGFAFTNGITYEFESETIIGPKEYLVLARDPNALEAAYGISGVYGPYSGQLSNNGEQIEFSNKNGEIIISFQYDDEMPWPVSPDGTGHSLILAKLGGDPEEASSWSPSSFINGSPGGPDTVQTEPEDPTVENIIDVGHTGRYFKGTTEPSPGFGGEATTLWTEINFNDDPGTTSWREGPSGYGYGSDPAEIATINTFLNDMPGNYPSVYARLRFNLTAKQIASYTQLRSTVYYDDGYVLYLNGVEISRANVSGDPPQYYTEGNTASDYGPITQESSSWISLLLPGTNVLAIQGHNTNFTSSSDFVMTAVLDGVIAPASNGNNASARVVINELLANDNPPSSTDWIELYNPGPVAYDLSNTYLSDTRSNLLEYKIPDGTILEPGEFWSVRKGTDPDELPFGLDYDGETIFLTEATDDTVPEPFRVLDAVHYEATEPNITFGRYPDGSDYLDALSTATYNGPNSKHLISDIVINEIMYHHSTRDERYEYIELYNKGLNPISLNGWSFTDGISYEFEQDIELAPDSYLVVAKDPTFLESVYDNLTIGTNLFGPYSGNLDDHSERIRLSYPFERTSSDANGPETYMIIADEVTYYDGGQWPSWADGKGASLELTDPKSNNNTPYAWDDSDESAKSPWQYFTFTINGNDSNYTHGSVNVFDLLLLNSGELLIDDLELNINGFNYLMNNGFEAGELYWRILGNHVRSFSTTIDSHSGSQSLYLIATGHGDPGANRINQSLDNVSTGTVTFSGWARWLRGSNFLLLRTSRAQSPVQPPRPAYAFELDMPLDLGTPGRQNTAYVSNRAPDILEVKHSPTLPTDNEPITVTARVTDNDDTVQATLYYRSEGEGFFTNVPMVDDGTNNDVVAGDKIFTAIIPGARSGTMRAFYIEASDGISLNRFPTLSPHAENPERTCLVRVGDTLLNTELATYRIWLSNDVINTFTSRPNLSNELLDCTFVYNDTDVFYNAKIRYRGSPFLRPGSNWNPRDRHAYRIDFNPDQKFHDREEINLDNTEGGSRGPLQERASYWFYRQMGLQYSMQEFIRPIINGSSQNNYEDVQKIDGDYIDGWFPDDDDGYIHKIDDYFEYSVDGTSYSNLDEGLKYDSRHPLLKETYRWGFEKRSHRENDNWDHLFDFAVAMNTPSDDPDYEQIIESVIDPERFARILAIRHTVGDWDSYGYRRGKNNTFYYASLEDKWYLLPWDIDFTLGSGDGPSTDLFTMAASQFPEIYQFLHYPKYQQMYYQALRDLVEGPWKTSYGSNEAPTAFDIFLDDSADVLIADGAGNGRRDGIKQFVRDRRSYILTQIPAIEFNITTNSGQVFCTTESEIILEGTAPPEVSGISVNNVLTPVEFLGHHSFELTVQLEIGFNNILLRGLDEWGTPLSDLTDSITIIRVPVSEITSITPNPICSNEITDLTIHGNDFSSYGNVSVTLKKASSEIGFDALYVQNNQAFDRIDAATLLLDDYKSNLENTTHTSHTWINLSNPLGQGVFTTNEQNFAAPFNVDGENFAVRFTGYIYAPSAGTRYFGVNSDDGFSLWIDGHLVGEYANTRAPQTTDVNQNRTAGTMTYNFPNEGSYPLTLDFYENSGGEAIEFFQTDSAGDEPKLINVDAELIVFRDDASYEATDVVIEDENTITCQVDLTDAEPGIWTVIITPDCGDITQTNPDNGLQVVDCDN